MRKKAKYLHDAPVGSDTPQATKSGRTSNNSNKTNGRNTQRAQTPDEDDDERCESQPFLPAHGTIDPSSLAAGTDPLADDSPENTDSIFAKLDLSAYDFGSKTANMEFSYLSNMLGTGPQDLTTSSTAGILTGGTGQNPSYDYGFADMTVRDSNWAARGLATLLTGNENSPQNSASPPTPTAVEPSPSSLVAATQHRSLLGNEVMGPPASGSATTLANNNATSNPAPHVSPALPAHLAPRRRRDPETVYASVTHPFSYTPGYHGLIAYLKSRFDRPHLMRVARAMAAFRPSFIACTKTLKEEDLIFMEKCFQRTLLEYEKFISYSGTPTIVWRRTGQVAAVGKEFCILTGWTKEQLLGKRTFMVEFMDDHSVVEYYEGFSKLAFGDSRGATMMECTLLSPTGRKIPTACTWTIKRDVFDIPMMIVGNFLPILN